MPEAARVLRPDRVAVFVEHVRDDQDLGMALEPALLAHVHFQRAEAARERDLLRRGDLLVAKHGDFVVEERVRDLRERVGVELLG